MMQENNEEFSWKSYQLFDCFNNSLTLSQRTSRFFLPFDVKQLEILTPIEYLEKFSRVNHRRYVIYKRIFEKYRNHEGHLNIESLFDSLKSIYVDMMDTKLIRQLIVLLDLSSNVKITFSQFCGIAAFSERYFFNVFKQSDEINAQFEKDIIEILDFSSLKRKLFGINIHPSLEQILHFI